MSRERDKLTPFVPTTKEAEVPISATFLPAASALALSGTPTSEAVNVVTDATTAPRDASGPPSPLARDTQPSASPNDTVGILTGNKKAKEA